MVRGKPHSGPNWLSVGYADVDPGLSAFRNPDLLNSGFRRENWIISGIVDLAYQNEIEQVRPLDPNYNAFDDPQIQGTRWENFSDTFIGSRSAAETAIRLTRLKNQIRDTRDLSESGLGGFIAQLAGGLIDPLNVIPYFPAMGLKIMPSVVKQGGKLASASRFSLIRNRAVVGAADAAVGATIAEALLHPTQQLRTIDESIGAVHASAIFGGLLGGIVGATQRIPKIGGFDASSFTSSPHVNIHESEAMGFSPFVPEKTPFRLRGDVARGVDPFGNVSKTVADNYAMAYRMSGEDGRKFWNTVLTSDAQTRLKTQINTESDSPIVVDDSLSPVEKTVLDDYRQVYGRLGKQDKADVDTVIPERYKTYLDNPPETPSVRQTPEFTPDQIRGEEATRFEIDQLRQAGVPDDEINRIVNDLIDEYPGLNEARNQLLGDAARGPETTDLNQKINNIREQNDQVLIEMQELKETIDNYKFFINAGGTEDFLARQRKGLHQSKKELRNKQNKYDHLVQMERELIKNLNDQSGQKFPELVESFNKTKFQVKVSDPLVYEMWNKHIKRGPQDVIENVFSKGLPEDLKSDLRFEFLSDGSNTILISANFGDPEVSPHGFGRTIFFGNDGKIIVDHNEFGLSKKDQSKGIGREFYRAWFDFYEELGVDEVNLDANIDVGGYAWARYGFVPEEKSWERTKLLLQIKFNEEIRPQLIEQLGAKRASELANKMDELLFSENPKAIWDIVDIRDKLTIEGKTQNIGKHLLLKRSWHGKIELKRDPEALARFKEYTKPSK